MHALKTNKPLEEPVVLKANDLFALPPAKPRRFPGVSSFEDTELSGELFYGREEESQKLLHTILAETLVVIFAYSGYGKTSLLKASVFKRLREKNIYPVLVRFNKIGTTPQELIKQETEALGEDKNLDVLHYQQKGEPPADGSLVAHFKSLEIWSKEDKLLTPAIVLDQFEELFTFPHNRPHIKTLFEDLAALLRECKEGSVRLKIIVSIREDFLGHLEGMAANVPAIFSNRVRLEALQKGPAKKAMAEPAKKEIANIEFASPRFTFSETSINEIENFLAQKASDENPSNNIEPVQLQIVCSELENKIIKGEIQPDESGQIVIQPMHYGRKEGLQKIAANFYERQMTAMQKEISLAKKETDAVKRLIETGLIAGGRRVPMSYDAVINKPGINKTAIDFLVQSKLLKVESHRNNSLLELSHDTLVAPVLEAGKQKDTERKIKRLVFIYLPLVLILAGIAIAFYFSRKSTEQARQDKFYYTALLAGRENPTLGYKIALDGYATGNTTPKLDTLIRQFQDGKNAFITKRFYFNEPVLAAYLSKNDEQLTIIGRRYKETWDINKMSRLSSEQPEEINAVFKRDENYYTFYSRGADSLYLKNEKGNIVDSTIVAALTKDRETDADFAKLNIRLYEELFLRKTKTPIYTHFQSSDASISHGNNQTLYFYNNIAYLHIRKNDSFYSFRVYDTTFAPLPAIVKTKKLNRLSLVNNFFDDEDTLKAFAATPDFRYFIYSDGYNVKILDYDFAHAALKQKKELDKSVGEVSYIMPSPDGSVFLTAGKKSTPRLWNLNGDLVAVLQGHNAPLTSASFSANGKRIITADEDGQIFIWKLAKDIQPGELVKFSPFDFHSLGLTENQYELQKIYDTSFFKNLLTSTLYYASSLPVNNLYPANLIYSKKLADATIEVQSLYSALLRRDSFELLSESEKVYWTRKYTALFFTSFDYDVYQPGFSATATQRFDDCFDWVSKRLVKKTGADNYYDYRMNMLTQANGFFMGRKDYKTANKYLKLEIGLHKAAVQSNEPQTSQLNSRVSNLFNSLSYYKLFERDYKGAVAAADSALKYDSTKNIPYTNKALGYLLDGLFEKAKDIYETHKDLSYSFMNDFAALESAEIISPRDTARYNDVQKIKALLQIPDHSIVNPRR